MSALLTSNPPAGSDGIAPVYQPNARWTQWNMTELWQGPTTIGNGKYVPNVDDLAIDLTTYQWYRVVSIDPTTFAPTFKAVQASIPEDQFSDEDRLLGPEPGHTPNTFIMYIDKSTKPYTAAVDARLYVLGTATRTMTIMKGSTLDNTGKIISAVYDQSGNLIGQEVPLEDRPFYDPDTNQLLGSCKVALPFNTTEDLQDGEVVTAIFRSDTGNVVSKTQLMVQNTGFIRAPSDGVKYVTGISLESPFLSSSDPTLIQYPLNVPLSGLNLMGVVNYSDGSKIRLPVDNTKFSMFGLNTGFVATVIGQKLDLVLKYALSPGEVAYGTSVNQGNFITQAYKAITVEPDGQYTVKLFAYPVWIDPVNGYRLEWFLLNLDRNTWYRVTPHVQFQNALNPIGYGVRQNLQVQINLQDVNGTYKNYIHTQTVAISLLKQGTETATNWTVAYTPGQNPEFGVNSFAASWFVNQNLWKVNLTMGQPNLTNWLSTVYWPTQPLVDTAKEIQAPTPTHFQLLIGDTVTEFPISQWNQDLVVNQAVPPFSTLFVKFIERTVDNDLQLAIAGFPVYQQN